MGYFKCCTHLYLHPALGLQSQLCPHLQCDSGPGLSPLPFPFCRQGTELEGLQVLSSLISVASGFGLPRKGC